jgi:hypothetical protein
MKGYVKFDHPPDEPHFFGYRAPGGKVGVRAPGGGELDPRLDLYNHSPDGFEWGYGGSGPAQLALAILAYTIQNNDLAVQLHQDFKRDFVAKLDRDRWYITLAHVREWSAHQLKERRLASELPKRVAIFPDEAIAAVCELIECNAEDFVAEFEESGGITAIGAPWCPHCGRQTLQSLGMVVDGAFQPGTSQGYGTCDICGERFHYFRMEFDGRVYFATGRRVGPETSST